MLHLKEYKIVTSSSADDPPHLSRPDVRLPNVLQLKQNNCVDLVWRYHGTWLPLNSVANCFVHLQTIPSQNHGGNESRLPSNSRPPRNPPIHSFIQFEFNQRSFMAILVSCHSTCICLDQQNVSTPNSQNVLHPVTTRERRVGMRVLKIFCQQIANYVPFVSSIFGFQLSAQCTIN